MTRPGWITRQIRRGRIAWLRRSARGLELEAVDLELYSPTIARALRSEVAAMRRKADRLKQSLT